MAYDIIIENLSVVYRTGGAKKPALTNINLKVREGETILISGPAGAGKSTLCRCINGLIPHFFKCELKSESSVQVRGFDVRWTDIPTLSRHVGTVFDDPANQLVCPTVINEIAFPMENFGFPPEMMRRRISKYLKVTRLEGYELRHPYSLSGGEQQECVLASVLALEPEVLILDEPTSALDPIGTDMIISKIKDIKGKTKIIVSNKLDEMVAIADRVIVMNEGRIILQGKPREVFEEVDILEKIGITPPQVTRLFIELKKMGFDIESVPLTLNEARIGMLKILKAHMRPTFQAKQVPALMREQYKEEPVIQIRGLYHTYPGGITALKGIDLDIYQGEYVAIIGQNGSGKTTLVKHIVGLFDSSMYRGKVKCYNMDMATTPTFEIAKKVGFVFQNPDRQMFSLYVEDELKFGPRNINLPEEETKRRVQEVLKALKIEHLKDEKITDLSQGEKQRLCLASVLVMDPKTLIVDEPTTGQDPRMRREIMDILMRSYKEKNITVLVITHDIQLVAEYARRCIVLSNGKILSDSTTRRIFSQPEKLKITYLSPPQVTMLGQKLVDKGMPPDVLTVEEMKNFLSQALGGH